MPLEQLSGILSLLRVHDKGTKYGPPDDRIDVEVVVQFANRPNEAFGFQLRSDTQGAAREGMLGLLRDGFNHGWTTTIDYERAAGHRHGVAIRVWLTRQQSAASGQIDVSTRRAQRATRGKSARSK